MPTTNDLTPNLGLPLPHADNSLDVDVGRLRDALGAIDTAVAGKQNTLAYTPENPANKGVPDGYASLDGGGKVPASQLPGYVDDVLEYANLAALPVTGESGKIYVVLDTGKTYRWGGTDYAEISASPGSTDAVPEGAANLYHTVARVRDAVLTGLSVAANAAVSAADTVLSAIGKLQAQITAHFGAGGAVHAAATDAANGFMAAADKQKLDGIAEGATANVGDVTLNGVQSLGGKTLVDVVLSGSVTEDVFVLTGTAPALDPGNGTIQTWVLTANSTPTDALASGQFMVLLVDDGASFSATWPTTVWSKVGGGGMAPDLAATGHTVILFWKIGATLYGSHIGDVA